MVNLYGHSNFKQGDYVKVCLQGRPSIQDIDFKEFQMYKLLQKPLPIETKPRELYFSVNQQEAPSSESVS